MRIGFPLCRRAGIFRFSMHYVSLLCATDLMELLNIGVGGKFLAGCFDALCGQLCWLGSLGFFGTTRAIAEEIKFLFGSHRIVECFCNMNRTFPVDNIALLITWVVIQIPRIPECLMNERIQIYWPNIGLCVITLNNRLYIIA